MRFPRKLSSINDLGWTDRVLTLTFSFNPLRTQAKDQNQRSVSSKDRVETDGRTDERR